MLAFQALDDPAGGDDDDFRIAWLRGSDADTDPWNDFGGDGLFLVAPDALAPGGSATSSILSSVADGVLSGGPETLRLPFRFFPALLRRGVVSGAMISDTGDLFSIRDGLLCGGIRLDHLAAIGDFLGVITDPPCDGGARADLIDVAIAGGSVVVQDDWGGFYPVRFAATPPDLDLDGDGLEGFVIETGDGCQPVVTSCTDGDGSVIDGRSCVLSPAIADGYSAAFQFSAVRARLGGVATAID